MNFVVFGLILICCHAWAIEIDDNFAAIWFEGPKINLENFFEKLKSSVQNGTSGLNIYGIPIRDPMFIETAIRLPTGVLSAFVGDTNLEGFLKNFNLSGLASYNVNSAKFKPIDLTAHIDISWPCINASTNYSLKGNVLNYDIYGDGGINGTLHNFRTIMDVGFNLKDRYMQVQTIATKIFLDALKFNATGLYNDEDISKIFSKTISDVTSKLITTNQKTISHIINNFATRIFNKFLLTITFPDLLKAIGL
ncbi:PREDICTED: uncharacterized protein LOC108749768 [Trachymyrmex septentrionalis]|uniref:uncharacterized protein LOC108749768 n=1 Tax=Trachymyrmex septentrionalis TaxID=34720 RepID=UPI00084F018B|nr:PREDICTED: uncharacterized protein LOC108749768 [Trachymyrmex septentrionalis]